MALSYPPGWRTVRSRFVTRLNPTKRHVAGLPHDTRVPFIPMEAVGEYGGLDTSATRPLGEVLAGYTFFREGDVLLAKITPCFENGKGAVAANLTPGFGFGTTELHVISPSAAVDARFIFYVTLSHPFRLRGEGEMFGAGGQKRVPESFLLDFPLGVPSVLQQRAIVAFLDRKTASIDALVAKKRHLLDLLQEDRQALITELVTKGLDRSVPVKDSGVPWLGRMPSDWSLLRLKQLSHRISGRLVYQPAQYFSDSGLPFIMGNNVTERGIVLDETKFIPPEVNARFAHHALREGDVVTVRVGAPGVTAVVGPNEDGLNCGSLMIIRRNPAFHSFWLAAVMNSPVVRAQIDLVQYGAAQEQINITDAVNFWIPTPPLPEQRKIADVVRSKTAALDATADKVREQLLRLREYRQALITDAVTGRIEISTEAA